VPAAASAAPRVEFLVPKPGVEISAPKRAREGADAPKGFVLSQVVGSGDVAPTVIQPSRASSSKNDAPAAWMQRRIQVCFTDSSFFSFAQGQRKAIAR
jgi:hypothetical protein